MSERTKEKGMVAVVDQSSKSIQKTEVRQDPLMYYQICISRMICYLLCQQSAPEVEVETFRGDPLEYYYYISVFREAVELKIDDPHDRLVRLLKYTEGEARDTIKRFIQQTPETGYQKVKGIMEIHIEFWQLTGKR